MKLAATNDRAQGTPIQKMPRPDKRRRATRYDSRSLDGWIDRLLTGDDKTWRAFVAEVTPYLQAVIGRQLGPALHEVLASDAMEDILGAIWLQLVERDMEALREWAEGQRKASLKGWLALLTSRRAVDHLRERVAETEAKGKARTQADETEATDGERAALYAALERGLDESPAEWLARVTEESSKMGKQFARVLGATGHHIQALRERGIEPGAVTLFDRAAHAKARGARLAAKKKPRVLHVKRQPNGLVR